MRIADRVYLSIKIEKKELPFHLCAFNSFQLHESTNASLPTASLSFVDTVGVFKEAITLADNMAVKVTVGVSADKSQQVDMRIFSWSRRNESGSDHYTINFLLDKPKYFYESTSKSIKKTSYDALKAIADECGLEFDGDKTADEQVWLPLNSRWCQFARKIASAGFIDGSSCMVLGITTAGKMLYHNYMGINYKTAKTTRLIHGKKGDYETKFTIVGFKQISKAGFQNASGGYKQTTMIQGVGSKPYATADKVKPKLMTENMNVNKEQQGKISKSRTEVAPIDCGNLHAQHQVAVHQNARMKLLQNCGMQVVVDYFTDLHIFQPVNILVYDHANSIEPSTNVDYSGYYLIIEKTCYVSEDAMYFEKFTLVRDGINADAGKTKKLT